MRYRQVKVESQSEYEVPWINEELAVEGNKFKYQGKHWEVIDVFNKTLPENILEDYEKWVI